MKILIALLALAVPGTAFAQMDAAHRADHRRIQQMNRQAAAAYARRDRRMQAQNRQSAAAYKTARERYDREMAEWRHRVAECNAGNYSACDKR